MEENKNGVKEFAHIKGALEIIHHKADGSVSVRRKDNLILNAGFDFIADAIGKSASRPNVMSHIAVGTGNTEVAAAQTALATELSRKAANYQHTPGTKIFTFTTTFNPGEATGAITEAGVCNAASAGTFIDRVTFAVVNKAADDTVTLNFQFTLS